jgi:hypothetical protein
MIAISLFATKEIKLYRSFINYFNLMVFSFLMFKSGKIYAAAFKKHPNIHNKE